MSRNKPPRFHHYVPKTYLKHWLDDNELIHIYNKKSDVLKPSSIDGQYFGKNHLNTITYPDGQKAIWVENAFSELEASVSPVLSKIASTKLAQSIDISYDDKLMLSMFVSAQFWRLPANRDFVQHQIEFNDFKSAELSVSSTTSGERLSELESKRLYKEISQTDIFRKAYPILMALITTKKHSNSLNLEKWSFYFQNPGFNLTSDNPILYCKKPDVDTIFSDLILPISPGVLLIASDNPPQELTPKMSNALNILQIRNGNQFIAGNNADYLRTIADMYKESFASKPLHDLENYVYSEIFS